MANKVGKISPIKRKYTKEGGQSLSSSLADNGLTKFPHTMNMIWPFKEKDGSYRTGLDENANYIKVMEKTSPEDAKIEKSIVSKLKEDIQLLAGGMDLGPRSKFYSQPFDDFYNTEERCKSAKLEDKPNIFKLGVFMEAVTYAWLRVHPSIAPSYHAWEANQPSPACPDISQCKFFVDDIEYQAEVEFKRKDIINKAVAKIVDMTPTRRLQVAKLLGLPVSPDSKEELVYNQLDDFIRQPSAKSDTANVMLFNTIANMADANLNLRYKVKQGFELNYYRNYKNKIFLGKEEIAKNEDELIDFLLDDKNQEYLIALEENIKAQAAQL